MHGPQNGLRLVGLLPLGWTGAGHQNTENNSPSPKRGSKSRRGKGLLQHIEPSVGRLKVDQSGPGQIPYEVMDRNHGDGFTGRCPNVSDVQNCTSPIDEIN